MSMLNLLAHHIRKNGPVATARVSSAQAKGTAKGYAYFGVVRYELRLSRDGHPINVALERASSDRRSERLAERDCDDLCSREGRVHLQAIGRLSDADATDVLSRIGHADAVNRYISRRVTISRPLTLLERLMVRRLLAANRPGYGRDRHATENAVRDGRFFQRGRWIENRQNYDITYCPFSDDRDAAEFAAETNQERRRRIYAACGERVVTDACRTLLQQDDYGRLYESWDGQRVCRVVCPSTGSVYWLPVGYSARTAKEAVAESFGLREVEYSPTAEA